MTFRHSIPVRYGEVDMQRVVFNAHYLAYCDDAVEAWFVSSGYSMATHGIDFMVKKATIEWRGAAGHRDVVDIDVAVRRWGTTSFTTEMRGSVRGNEVFVAELVYVGVVPGTTETLRIGDDVRALLGPAVDDSSA